MGDISTLINEKKYSDLVRACDQSEIESATNPNINLAAIYPVSLAGLILLEDLQSARYVRKRILSTSNNTPEVDAMWAVVVALIKKSYPEVYIRLDAFQWSEGVQQLVEDIKTRTRENMLAIISHIYTSIELSQASNYFGLSEDEVLREMKSRGWEFNESIRVLHPTKPTPAPRVATDSNQFAKLADIVLNLEKF